MQTIWLIIAFRKRIYLEKLDRKAAMLYLNKKINPKFQSNDSMDQNNNLRKNLESKRTIYSFSKLDDNNPLVTLQTKISRDSLKTL